MRSFKRFLRGSIATAGFAVGLQLAGCGEGL